MTTPAPDHVIPVSALPACPYCGHDGALVRVHGHSQCPACQAIVERCCE